MKKLFWISWYQQTEDYRPLSYPPGEAVLGWWKTGIRCHDDSSTLVALVVASSKDEAMTNVKKDWPEAHEFRFCDETHSLKLSDRFPLNEWMKDRFKSFPLSPP